MGITTVFAEITKSDVHEDGTLMVHGRVSDETLDIDKQVCDGSWLAQAIPDWFKSGGNLRYMHQNHAIGVATEYEEKDGGHFIEAKVVDPGAVQKVQHGVLKGFSIGIRDPRIVTDKAAPGGRIVGGNVVEVSLVDRPANPACTLTLAKSAMPGMTVRGADYDEATRLVRVEELAEAAEKAAGPDDEVLDDAAKTAHTQVLTAEAETVAVVAEDAPTEGPADSGAPAPADPGEGTGDAGAPEAPPEPEAPETDVAPDVPATDAAPAEDAAVEPAAEAPPADVEPAVKAAGLTVEDIATAVADILAKRDYSGKERATMASAGTAMAGGGFPIKTVKDLKNAIQAIGRAKDPQTAKDHIMARAKALGRNDLIPQGWEAEAGKAAGTDEMAHDPAALQAVRDGLLNLIIAEAQEMKAGEDEVYDISCLLDALARFLCWWDGEAMEGEAPDVAAVKFAGESGPELVTLTTATTVATAATEVIKFVAADTTKGAGCGCCDNCGTDKAATAPETTTPDDGVVSKTATSDTVKAAVAEAVTPLLAEVGTLTARLEQVEKAATPGGPTRTRQTLTGGNPAATATRARIAALKATAATVSHPDLAREYERQIADLTKSLDATVAAEPAA